MSKRTFLIFMANGDRHTVKADTFNGGSGEVSLMSDDSLAGYFNGVTAVVVQEEKPDPASAPTLVDPLPVVGSVADFAIRPTVEIGTLNITCQAGKQEFAAEIIKAIAGVHLVPGVV